MMLTDADIDRMTTGELWTMLFKLRDGLNRTTAGKAALGRFKRVLTVMAEYEKCGTPISWATAEKVAEWRTRK